MTDTKKEYLNSYSKSKSDYSTWIYLLIWLVLSALLIGGGVFLYNRWEKKNQFKQAQAWVWDTSKDQPEEPSNKEYEEARSRIFSNFCHVEKFRNRIKERPKELGKWNGDLDKIAKILITYDQLKAVKRDPEQLTETFLEVYRQTNILSRLETYLFPSEEFDQQYDEQEKWMEEKMPEEEAAAQEPTDRLMRHFFKLFYDRLSPEAKTPSNILPLQIQGREVDTKAEILKEETDYLLSQNYEWHEKSGLVRVIPLPGYFSGFAGFKKDLDSAKSNESTQTMGLTSPAEEHKYWDKVEMGGNVFSYSTQPSRSLIELKSHLLFSRQNRNYTVWLTKYINKNGKEGYRTLDISEKSLLNTIAHELAHAVINSIRLIYKGDDNGGHGDLHDKYMDEMEELIKNSQEWEEYLAWWREPRKNGNS